jgi:IS605 OrfB family transposase
MMFFSKNIFNSTIFFSNVFYKFKFNIFDEFISYLILNKIKFDFSNCPKHEITVKIKGKKVIKMVYDDNVIKQINDLKQKANQFIYDNFQFYIDLYLKILKYSKYNFRPMFHHISGYIDIDKITITSKNVDKIAADFIDDINVHGFGFKFDDNTFHECYVKVVYKVLNNIYRKQQLSKKLPIDDAFTDKINNIILTPVFNIVNNNLDKLLKKRDLKLTDQSIITNIVKHFNSEACGQLPYDMVHELIAKSFISYTSYYEALKVNPFARKPNYLDKENGRYILRLTRKSTNIIKKTYDDDGYLIKTEKYKPNSSNNEDTNVEYLIGVPTGKYVSKHYLSLTGDKKLVKIGENNRYGHVFYAKKKFIKIDKPDKVTKSFINKHYKYKNKYIAKDNSNIINGGMIYFNIAKEIVDKFTYMEISMDDNNNFKLNLSYSVNKINQPKNINKVASADLGGVNLMTVYSSHNESIIIPGGPIKSWNYFCNMKIDKLKSRKATGKKTIDRTIKYTKNGKNYTVKEEIDTKTLIRNLRTGRLNRINDYFNKIAKYMVDIYCKESDIDTFIIGLNEGWKNKINIGKKNNRDFSSIPHSRLIQKIKDKADLAGIKVIVREESYTSKCDALSLESVEKHQEYMGRRTKRGLFKSGTGKLLNADINGAINIMRKELESTNKTLKRMMNNEIKELVQETKKVVKYPRKINVWAELNNQ